MRSGSLERPLLSRRYNIDLKARRGRLYFCRGKPTDLFKPDKSHSNCSASCLRGAEEGSSAFVITVKGVASLGFRIYIVRDILRNQHYIFSQDFFNRVPVWLCLTIIVLSGIADGSMNLVTRGVTTRKMIHDFFAPATEVVEPDYFSDKSGLVYAWMWVVWACGIGSSLFASQAAFLASVTLSEYVSDDLDLIVAIGVVVAIANFASNVSYRVKKGVRNYQRQLEGELTYSPLAIMVCVVASTAFFGQCYYGSTESTRVMLRLFNIYKGNPNAGIDVDERVESWITGFADATLPISMISYFYSQCFEFLSNEVPIKSEYFSFSTKQLRLIYNKLKETLPYFRDLHWYQKDVWCPMLMFTLGVTLMPFFIFWEMFGNALSIFNGCNGLLIHWFVHGKAVFLDGKRVFSPVQKACIGMGSTFLTIINAAIYWKFNIIDWINNMQEIWGGVILEVLERAQLYSSNSDDAFEELKTSLEVASGDLEFPAADCWGRLFGGSDGYEMVPLEETAGGYPPAQYSAGLEK